MAARALKRSDTVLPGDEVLAADLLARKPHNVVAVALANKMVRIARAVMVSGEQYRLNLA